MMNALRRQTGRKAPRRSEAPCFTVASWLELRIGFERAIAQVVAENQRRRGNIELLQGEGQR